MSNFKIIDMKTNKMVKGMLYGSYEQARDIWLSFTDESKARFLVVAE